MEFLKRVESKGPLSCDTILKIFYQTCRAVQHMHRQKPPVIHRDLKVPPAIASACWVPSCSCRHGCSKASRWLPLVSWVSSPQWLGSGPTLAALAGRPRLRRLGRSLRSPTLHQQAWLLWSRLAVCRRPCRLALGAAWPWWSSPSVPSCQLCCCFSLLCIGLIRMPLCSQST